MKAGKRGEETEKQFRLINGVYLSFCHFGSLQLFLIFGAPACDSGRFVSGSLGRCMCTYVYVHVYVHVQIVTPAYRATHLCTVRTFPRW